MTGLAGELRGWRQRRRLSQLELALRAGTTQRHLSFIERGRSIPGRAMVVRLAESLELPLRERNELLLTAGYAPAYGEAALDDDALRPVRSALERILDGHRPFPAIVVDRHGVVVAANPEFELITRGAAPELLEPPVNAYRVALHPRGIAPRVANFAEWARHVIGRLEQERRRNPDPRLQELLAELGGYVAAVRHEPGADHLGFAVPLHLRAGGAELRLLTTVTTFATAVDVTLAELKLEAFLPADESTARALGRLGGRSV